MLISINLCFSGVGIYGNKTKRAENPDTSTANANRMDEVDKTDKVENPDTDKAGVDKADGAYGANRAKDSDICIAEKDIPDGAEDPDTSTVSLD